MNNFSDLFSDYDQSFSSKLSVLRGLSDSEIIEAAEALVSENQPIASEAMLWVHWFYKRNDDLQPLLYLEVLNRFRTYTPTYCEWVWQWALAYEGSAATDQKVEVGLNLAQALSNSPIRQHESAQWILRFVDRLALNPENLNLVFSTLKPNVSRAENNLSKFGFLSEEKLSKYFAARDKAICAFFFRHYYNFSHLFASKETYLQRLEELSGEAQDWYGSPSWPLTSGDQT